MNECNYSDSEFTMYTRLLCQHIKPQDFFSLKKNNIEKNQRRRRLKKSLQRSWDVVPKSEKVPGTSVSLKKKSGLLYLYTGNEGSLQKAALHGEGGWRAAAMSSKQQRSEASACFCAMHRFSQGE